MRGIINIVLGLVFIIGGLSGTLVMKGTHSGGAPPSPECSSASSAFIASPAARNKLPGSCQQAQLARASELEARTSRRELRVL
jgi:hypothetical protein